ncbi:MAG: putative flavin-binding monooxygenase [Acidimicrobiales bacterium]|nr:putative flavin-binding monooxygenase [Acidimicrobiales bacterium]
MASFPPATRFSPSGAAATLLRLVDRVPRRGAEASGHGRAAAPRVAIIGSGFGGIGMAIRLRQAGIDSFTIFEKAERIGGTWRDNTYPGAGCDVPSHLYSFSFVPKHDWSRKFPGQAEILEYLDDCVERFELRPHVRFGTEVTAATFDATAGCWQLDLADGSTHVADVLVAATGQLNRPHVPDIEGLDSFAGPSFHSARWDHDIDLTDRDVAVVGIGASAIQFVPEIAPKVRTLTLFQRSSNYVAPKPDKPISARTQWLFRNVDPLRRLYRAQIWLRFDAKFTWFRQGSRIGRLGERKFEQGLAPLVSEELSRQALVPDYPLGCKRILISNDWYPTLLRPNVSVVTDGVDRVTPHGIVAGGTERTADVIVFGTGFQTTSFLAPMVVTGLGGRDLHETWSDGAEAHLGMTVAGFPNLFLLYGPNTNLGHNSIIFMLERQIGYVLQCLRRLASERLAWIDVRPEAMARSNRRLQQELDRTVWAAGCHSWYKNPAGKITNNWSSYTWRYWLRTARPRWSEFRVAAAVPAPIGAARAR